MDVFGGVRGEAKEKINPFAVDKQDALKDVNLSIDMFEGRRIRKKSILQSMRDGTYGQEESAPNWEYNRVNENNFDVVLRWQKKEVLRIRNLERKEARIALNGLKVFYDTINAVNPDLSHPDICKCYNITATKYKLKQVPVPETLDRNIHRHPFAGVTGDLRDYKNNLLAREVKKCQEIVDLTQDLLEVIELPFRKREPRLRITSTAFLKPSFEEIVTHFDLTFIFANEVIQLEENVPIHRAKVAISSLRGWLKKIDVETPNLKDESLKFCYEALKRYHKPTIERVKDVRLLAMEDGGASFWSEKKHKWIFGKIDSNGNFTPPDWAE